MRHIPGRGTIVPDFRSVGIKAGKRSGDRPVIIRAVSSRDAVFASVEDSSFALLRHITGSL